MDNYTIDDVVITTDGQRIISAPEATVRIDLNSIEVLITEVALSPASFNFLDKFRQGECTIIGKMDNRNLQVDRARVDGFTLAGTRGKEVLYRNIIFVALHAKWIFNGKMLVQNEVKSLQYGFLACRHSLF